MVDKKIVKEVLYGVAIGDALGVPVEFLYRDEVRKINIQNMEGTDSNFKYGTRWGDMTPKGSWSDDTAMTLASVDALCETGYEPSTFMENYLFWLKDGKYSSLDYAFGLGGCCAKAINNYRFNKDAYNCGCTGERDNGNGALMRISPVCLALLNSNYDMDEKVKILDTLGGITHAHPISKLANFIYLLFMEKAIETKDKNIAFNYIINYDYEKYYDIETIDKYSDILNKKILKLKDIEEKRNGYVIDTLEGVIFSIMNNNNFRDSVLCSINLGYDTDTLAAITGSLAAILYGYENIPKEWINDLKNKDYLDEMIDRFSNKYCVLKKTKNKL